MVGLVIRPGSGMAYRRAGERLYLQVSNGLYYIRGDLQSVLVEI